MGCQRWAWGLTGSLSQLLPLHLMHTFLNGVGQAGLESVVPGPWATAELTCLPRQSQQPWTVREGSVGALGFSLPVSAHSETERATPHCPTLCCVSGSVYPPSSVAVSEMPPPSGHFVKWLLGEVCSVPHATATALWKKVGLAEMWWGGGALLYGWINKMT